MLSVRALLLATGAAHAAYISGPAAASRMQLRSVSTPDMMASPTGMAILFDCDGVLADTERDGHRVSFNKVFAEKGYSFEWTVEEYGRMCEVGGGKERMTAYFNGFNGYCKDGWPVGFELPTTEELAKGLPVDPERLELVKGMHQRKTALFQELIASGVVPLRPGILRIVDEAIAADVPLAVCSTSNEAAVRTLVETLMGPERYAKFQFFCGDCVPRKKPNPDVYNLAAETMGLDKSECVVIEDSGIGNKAAKAAGMTCLVTQSTYTAEEDFTGADRIVPELGEPADGVCVTLSDLRALMPQPVASVSPTD
jgi:HAD superfamily hydrolase (TIGR01509 family)